MNCAATRVAAPGSRVAPRVRPPRSGHLTAREGAGPGCWGGAAGDSGTLTEHVLKVRGNE